MAWPSSPWSTSRAANSGLFRQAGALFALEIVRLMGELLDALGHAHSNGITHRDVKPANIFLLKSGQAKVGDFGIARIESSNLTQAGSVLGTPPVHVPEQFMGQRSTAAPTFSPPASSSTSS